MGNGLDQIARLHGEPWVRSMPPCRVQLAEESDCPAIQVILSPAVQQGVAYMASSPPSIDEIASELHNAKGRYPWVVAVDPESRTIGVARSGPWKTRRGYAWTTEIGVYVASHHHRRGVGSLLYAALFPLIEQRGFRSVLAGIELPNPASVRLHEKFGMAHVGTLPNIGFKLGAWRSVGYWHCFLGSVDEAPDTGIFGA